MSGIHDVILDEVREALQAALIDEIPTDDPTRAGVVKRGPLQGDPDPDQARISVTLYENDPDRFYGATGTTALTEMWDDEIAEVECGGSITWRRRFTVKARCLLVNTQEDETAARTVASTIRSRIEKTLMRITLKNVTEDGEFVSKSIFNDAIKGEMVQAGGPPDAYDYHIKVRFQVETTIGVPQL